MGYSTGILVGNIHLTRKLAAWRSDTVACQANGSDRKKLFHVLQRRDLGYKLYMSTPYAEIMANSIVMSVCLTSNWCGIQEATLSLYSLIC